MYSHPIVETMALGLAPLHQGTTAPDRLGRYLAICDACPRLTDTGCGACSTCAGNRYGAWQKILVAGNCPEKRFTQQTTEPIMSAPTIQFPTETGLYWCRVATAGPTGATGSASAYNALIVLSGVLPFFSLRVLPLDAQGDRGSRQWQPADVLAIGPAVAIPALAAP